MNAPVAGARLAPSLSPRARARLLWLRIHRWTGLGAMIVFLAIAVSGMALVWRDTTERTVHPARVPLASGSTKATAGAVLDAGRSALPAGSRPVQLQLAGRTGAAVLTGEADGPPIWGIGPPRRPRVWIDPVDARVLGRSAGEPDAIFVLKAVHGHLLIAGFGRSLMATAGVLLAISAGTGVYLWWPGRRNLLRALKWRRQFSRSMNLHRIIGPLAALGLIAQGLTGVFMALPWLLAPSAPAAPPPVAGRPLAATQRSADQVIALAGAAKPATIQLPTEGDSRWRLAYAGGAKVTVGDADGTIERAGPPPPSTTAKLDDAVSNLHSGGYGLIHQVLLFLAGSALAMFAVTGILLWSQGRKRSAR